MIAILYSLDGNDSQSLMVTPDARVVTPDGLTRASALVPGEVMLSMDGSAVLVDSVLMGDFHGTLTDIATFLHGNRINDGHILLAAGVQIADFYAQHHARDPSLDDSNEAYLDGLLASDDAIDVFPSDPSTDDSSDDRSTSPTGTHPSSKRSNVPSGDYVAPSPPALTMSMPTAQGRRQLRDFSSCLQRSIADLESAYPNQVWPYSPVSICTPPKSIEVREAAKVGADGHLHLTITCQPGNRVDDLAVAGGSGARGIHAVQLKSRSVHVGSLVARPGSRVVATAMCRSTR
jgi:hypothetical protein